MEVSLFDEMNLFDKMNRADQLEHMMDEETPDMKSEVMLMSPLHEPYIYENQEINRVSLDYPSAGYFSDHADLQSLQYDKMTENDQTEIKQVVCNIYGTPVRSNSCSLGMEDTKKVVRHWKNFG